MDKQFDELSKSLAQNVSRREALTKFGVGLAGVLLAAIGVSGPASAGGNCASDADCPHNSRFCCSGKCSNLTDNQNCGGCGQRCSGNTHCKVVGVPGW